MVGMIEEETRVDDEMFVVVCRLSSCTYEVHLPIAITRFSPKKPVTLCTKILCHSKFNSSEPAIAIGRCTSYLVSCDDENDGLSLR